MNKRSLAGLALTGLILTGAGCFGQAPDRVKEEVKDEVKEPVVNEVISAYDQIEVMSPLENEVVSSPLTVSGRARGVWYFEASFPIEMYDANGTLLGIEPAQAQGEWMTENWVEFETVLEFDDPTTETGTLVLKKDNPSGLPEYDKKLEIPVRFEE